MEVYAWLLISKLTLNLNYQLQNLTNGNWEFANYGMS